MNANELADKLDEYGTHLNELASTMLRQQQAEIKALKKLVSEMKYEKSSGVYEMNNEPVAWMDEINTFVLDKDYKQFPKSLQNGMIPLYTHPVKEQGNPVAWRSQDPDGYWSVYQSPVKGAEPLYTGFKELTDEEIAEVYEKCEWASGYVSWKEFARAILRKAQEK